MAWSSCRPAGCWTTCTRCRSMRCGGSGSAAPRYSTASIKVRLADFRTLNRSRTLGAPTDVTKEIFETALSLYEILRPGDRIRLVGVRIEGLLDAGRAPRQLALGARERGWSEAERAADAAIARFGAAAVRPASLLGPAGQLRGADWTGAPGPWDAAPE